MADHPASPKSVGSNAARNGSGSDIPTPETCAQMQSVLEYMLLTMGLSNHDAMSLCMDTAIAMAALGCVNRVAAITVLGSVADLFKVKADRAVVFLHEYKMYEDEGRTQ